MVILQNMLNNPGFIDVPYDVYSLKSDAKSDQLNCHQEKESQINIVTSGKHAYSL